MGDHTRYTRCTRILRLQFRIHRLIHFRAELRSAAMLSDPRPPSRDPQINEALGRRKQRFRHFSSLCLGNAKHCCPATRPDFLMKIHARKQRKSSLPPREFNHARQLTLGMINFYSALARSTPRWGWPLHARFTGLAAVRTSGRILQLKIPLCHEYDEATWAPAPLSLISVNSGNMSLGC